MCLRMQVESPDIVETHETYRGHEFVVTTGTGMGYRCGYVKVEKGHPWHGDGEPDADVHGGITFTEHDVECSKDGEDSGYWLGFDCGHAWDAKDPDIISGEYRLRSFEDDYMERMYCGGGLDGTIRSNGYVQRECKKLIDQAVAASGAD